MNFKSSLSRVPGAYLVNARIKEYQTVRKYQRICDKYAAVGRQGEFLELLQRRSSNSLARYASSIGGRRLFYLGTDEQQDRSGFLQALSKFGEVSIFTRDDGTYGHNPTSEPDWFDKNSSRLWNLFCEFHSQGKAPDVLLMQTWPSQIDVQVLERIRTTFKTLIVNISMDDRHQFEGRHSIGRWSGVRGLLPYIDIALTAAPESVDWYLKEGVPALFFPEGSDPTIFSPSEPTEKDFDVAFVGTRYGIREQLVIALRRAGINVTAYGSGWEGGRIATSRVPELFSRSKIILGVGTIGHCRNFCSLKLRDFDSPMSGSLYLTQYNPDLELFYDPGNEIVMYRSVNECVELAQYFLDNEEERERIALAGAHRARRDHTWQHRLASVFSAIDASVIN